jgi:hypothetical protein
MGAFGWAGMGLWRMRRGMGLWLVIAGMFLENSVFPLPLRDSHEADWGERSEVGRLKSLGLAWAQFTLPTLSLRSSATFP